MCMQSTNTQMHLILSIPIAAISHFLRLYEFKVTLSFWQQVMPTACCETDGIWLGEGWIYCFCLLSTISSFFPIVCLLLIDPPASFKRRGQAWHQGWRHRFSAAPGCPQRLQGGGAPVDSEWRRTWRQGQPQNDTTALHNAQGKCGGC